MSYSYFMCDIFVDEISLVFVVGFVMSTVIMFYGMHLRKTYKIDKFNLSLGYYEFVRLKRDIILFDRCTL